jgi:hypothetical protein
MTLSGRALKRLEGSFGDLRLCKYLLVVTPTEHIIRCFFFERTPYKGLFYFWRVVWPLYTQYPLVTLGYGKRLARGDHIDLGEVEFERSVARLAEIISQGELADLRSISSPQDFLDRFGDPKRYRISPLEAAFTYYLVGNISLCIDILEDFAGEDLRPGSVDRHLSARDLVREMRVDPSAGARKIKASEIATIKRYGLAPTIAPTRLQEYGLLRRKN